MLGEQGSEGKVWDLPNREIGKPGENRAQVVATGSFNLRQVSFASSWSPDSFSHSLVLLPFCRGAGRARLVVLWDPGSWCKHVPFHSVRGGSTLPYS